MTREIHAQIRELAKAKKAVILAHTYTDGAVQDVADFVGDSYGLSKKAAEIKDADIILFAGVRFMAETAAMLAPSKKVIVPVANAGCPMADMITEQKVRELRDTYPSAAVVCYVNSDAATKALSDVCVTSSNAVKIVSKLSQKDIIFIPDRHLGSFVAEQLEDKNIILYDGFCPVHNRITPMDVRDMKIKYPDAKVMMHPECSSETREEADFVLSTGQMIEMVQTAEHETYIVVTEEGIIHSLQKHNDKATFIPLIATPLLCENMKKIRIDHVLSALENEDNIIKVPSEIAQKAKKSLEMMLELAE